MAYNLYTRNFGATYANADVIIRRADNGAPAVIMASATGGTVNHRGMATLDGTGGLSVYIDDSYTWTFNIQDKTPTTYDIVKVATDAALGTQFVTNSGTPIGGWSGVGATPVYATPTQQAGIQSLVSGAWKALVAAPDATSAVAGSPPTMTLGTANANSTVLTDADVYSPPILPLDARIAGISGAMRLYSSGNYGPGYITETSAEGSPGWGFAFSTDAEAVDICFRDVTGTTFRVRYRVPGGAWQWASATDTTVSGSGSNFYYWKVDFGSSTLRDIEVYCGASNQIRGVCVGPSAGTTKALTKYKIWATTAYPTRAMVLGDSYTASVGATKIRNGWVYKMGELLGLPNIVASGAGGQGFLVGSNNGALTAIQRIADASKFGTIDLVIAAYGINDYSQNPAAVQAAAQSYFSALMAAQPTAYIIGIGPWTAPSKICPQAIETAIQAGFSAVADARRMTYIPTISVGWQDTSGLNSTLYMSGDNVHPNDAGHAYLGARAAGSVRTALRALMP